MLNFVKSTVFALAAMAIVGSVPAAAEGKFQPNPDAPCEDNVYVNSNSWIEAGDKFTVMFRADAVSNFLTALDNAEIAAGGKPLPAERRELIKIIAFGSFQDAGKWMTVIGFFDENECAVTALPALPVEAVLKLLKESFGLKVEPEGEDA